MSNPIVTVDTLHRTAKGFLDSGMATSAEHAMTILANLQLQIQVGACIGTSPTAQAALLTSITCAHRCFLGGVFVSGPVNVSLLVAQPGCHSLADAIHHWGGRIGKAPRPSTGIVLAGGEADRDTPTVWGTFHGWTGGVVISANDRLRESQENTLSGVLVGGMAVAEAFQMATNTNPRSGRRNIGMSLWEPSPATPWHLAPSGPEITYLPAHLWLIGLGHLGQAYLWTLGMLPYESPSQVRVLLQDTDQITPANLSTSPLTRSEHLGSFETRMTAHWAESRGFKTQITERSFTKQQRVHGDEPRIALCGVDNAEARAALDPDDFTFIVEAGLGKGWKEYLDLQLHSFPGPQHPSQRWAPGAQPLNTVPSTPAYAHLSGAGVDACGLLQLASRSVGACFVGCSAAALVVAELVRMLHGGQPMAVIDASLRDLTYRKTLPNQHAKQIIIPMTRAVAPHQPQKL